MTDAQLDALAVALDAERSRRARLHVCQSCGDRFEGRVDARFCSTRCRVKFHRTRGLPAELRSRDRWVLWTARDGRKIPLQTSGHAASSTDPLTWAPFDDVRGSRLPLGFVLNGDGIGCVDLDGVLTDGVLDPRAVEFLATLDPFYLEVSPSGRGLHAWVFGGSPDGRKVYKLANGLKVEHYTDKRFITVTGEKWAG